ncbi:hypothetical protein PENTCL1PPCAC_13524 [Pristionchus entomophagus]|uniref:Uncharacterized protein n=1 Tax=Pristionchus entomophagus TaxID=358040 RepID=A0AAV5TC83_9BILA|nr:hypothetical protein PENTCL1PPCAC_13524 [Pristionchus entomophagus]
MKGDLGFLVRYSSSLIPQPTKDPIAVNSTEWPDDDISTTIAPEPKQSSFSTSVTSPTQFPTTSSGFILIGSFLSTLLVTLWF